MEREATFQYQILRVPDRDAANCLFINGTLIHRTSDEFNESTKVFNELACETLELDISEIAKIQVCFSSNTRSLYDTFFQHWFSLTDGLDMLFHPYSETEAHQESLTKHFQNPVLKNSLHIRFRLEYQPLRRNWNTAQNIPTIYAARPAQQRRLYTTLY